MTSELFSINRSAWDRQVERGDRWTRPVSSQQVEAARRGSWEVVLTPNRPVPGHWFGDGVAGRRTLCLASGGGQQGPILAAAGARVTVFDASPRQLEQDRMVAERDGLGLELVEGDMADLGVFGDGAFDLVFHPVSNCFVPEVRPVWLEVFRVLSPGGVLLAGFANPVLYMFGDVEPGSDAPLVVHHAIPYSDQESLAEEERRRCLRDGVPLEFGHSLTDQIGGQLEAGFVLTGFYEDSHHVADHAVSRFTPTFMATRALKPEAA